MGGKGRASFAVASRTFIRSILGTIPAGRPVEDGDAEVSPLIHRSSPMRVWTRGPFWMPEPGRGPSHWKVNELMKARSLGLAAMLWLLLATSACQPARQWQGEAEPSPTTAPPLNGVNWNGEPFSLADDVAGRVAVVFFGYTYCPDVCPFTLAKMKQLKSTLGVQGEDLEMVFVSVDPRRDSLDKLAAYVPNFDRSFYGVRLELDALTDLQETWPLTVQYGQPKDGPGSDSYYYVDHTGTYFVIDRQGRLRLRFPPNATVEAMRPDIEVLLDE